METRKSHGGFTLVEMMVTVTVASVLAMVAVPNMQPMMQKRQLEGAASEVYNNLLLLRSQAVEKNRRAFVNFNESGTAWTYGLNEGASCTPTVSGTCVLNGTERVYQGSTWKTVTLDQAFAGNELYFEPRRGAASAYGTITLTSAAGEIRVIVSPIGYIWACSDKGLGGYKAC
jgi:type IV fimbrial biogenesis protein FimT